MKIQQLLTKHTMTSWFRCFISIFRHKYYVWRGSRKVGGVPWHRLLMHDLIKLHPKEFPGYANKFFGPDDDPKGFEFAWLHHQNRSDHHWEYFMVRSLHGDKGSRGVTAPYEILPMPWVCVREMVSDWVGASWVHTGSPKMDKWLKENLGIMQFNDITKARVADVLFGLGYIDAVKWMG